ncbi:MAG: hypothetical protein RIQ79_2161 [Verrucomicrobiota bacterium]|jgi:hypothetical protein
MKKSRLATLLALFSLAFAISAAAEDTSKAKPIPPEVLKKYDVNHDGKLDETELAAWKADKKAAAHEKKKHEHKGEGDKKPETTVTK